MKTKIHSGSWLECKVCPHSAEELAQKREKKERTFRRKRMAAATVDLAVRRQVAYELGPDAEPTSEEKFQILQKFGVAAARIDRAVTKPKWMTEGLWRTKQAEFKQATRGLVPRDRETKYDPKNNRTRSHNHNSQPRNYSGSRPNSVQAPTVARPR